MSMIQLKPVFRDVIQAIHQIAGDQPFHVATVRHVIPGEPGAYMQKLHYRGLMNRVQRPFGKRKGLWQIPAQVIHKLQEVKA